MVNPCQKELDEWNSAMQELEQAKALYNQYIVTEPLTPSADTENRGFNASQVEQASTQVKEAEKKCNEKYSAWMNCKANHGM